MEEVRASVRAIEEMSVREACEAFNLNPPNVYRWIKVRGLGVSSSTGRLTLRKGDIEELLNLADRAQRRDAHDAGVGFPSRTSIMEEGGLDSGDAELVNKIMRGRFDSYVMRCFKEVFGKGLKRVPVIVRWWGCAHVMNVQGCVRLSAGKFFFYLSSEAKRGFFYDATRGSRERLFLSRVDEDDYDKDIDARTFEQALGLS